MSGPSVVVVGGGLAGMAAALGAADGGASVTLVERRARLGGLTWSFRRNGLWFDNGQHVFLRCCTAYRSFLERIGAARDVHLQPRLDIPVLGPGGVRSSIRRSSLPAPLHLAAALARYRHLGLVDRAKLVPAVLALSRLSPEDPSLDRETFGQWLAEHGQGRWAIERLWDLVVLPTVNLPSAEASLSMAVRVFRTGLLDQADAGDMGWSLVPLGTLHGERGGRALEAAGVETLLGAPVASLEPDGGRWAVRVGDGSRLVADAVVVATAADAAAALLPSGALKAAPELGSSPIVNVHLVLDRRVTDLPFAACVGSPLQYVFDHSAAAGVERGQCLTISLSAADAYLGRRPEDLLATFSEALSGVFPSARHARVLDGVVTREHAATFRATPGTARLRPKSATAVPGIFVAGAWCDTGWPATMEGAVRSGTAAAAAVLATTTSGIGADATPQQLEGVSG